jgi:E3 ubiquitin-protein ligase RNF115/126
MLFRDSGDGGSASSGVSETLASMFNLVGDPGDYVFGQANFDRLISQLLDQEALKKMPPPASADMINSLPASKLKMEQIGKY